MIKPTDKGRKPELPPITPKDFINLVALMPKKGEKTGSAEGSETPSKPAWLPEKWKKGWFAANLARVTGKVESREAEAALEALLNREDGLEEYAHWLMSRLARPRDSWSGFAQHFAIQGFFERVIARNSGKFRKIARGGKESAASEERVNARILLLESISFASGVGSELQVSDRYIRDLFVRSAEASEWVDAQQKPIRWLQMSTRSMLTRKLLSQEFTKVSPDIRQALSVMEEEIADSIHRDATYAASSLRAEGEMQSLRSEIARCREEIKQAQLALELAAKEKDKIEDSRSDISRRSKDLFDGLRLNIADEIERLLKVAVEVAKSIEDPKKKDILTKQIDQTLSLGSDLRDPSKATKRAGG